MVVFTDFIYLTVNNFLSQSKPLPAGEQGKTRNTVTIRTVCANLYLSYGFSSHIFWEKPI